MRILALDLGTTTGWAYYGGDGVYSGVKKFGEKKNDRRGMRYVRFKKWIDQFGGVDLLVYEHVRGYKYYAAASVYYGLLSHIEALSAEFAIPLVGCNQITLKHQFCGYGKATKLDMCKRARELGWKGGLPGSEKNHDEADAWAMLYLECGKRGMEI